jgi:hypothetical protein
VRMSANEQTQNQTTNNQQKQQQQRQQQQDDQQQQADTSNVNMDLQNLFSTQLTSKQTPSQPQTSQSTTRTTTIDPKKIYEAVEGLFDNIRWFINRNINYEEANYQRWANKHVEWFNIIFNVFDQQTSPSEIIKIYISQMLGVELKEDLNVLVHIALSDKVIKEKKTLIRKIAQIFTAIWITLETEQDDSEESLEEALNKYSFNKSKYNDKKLNENIQTKHNEQSENTDSNDQFATTLEGEQRCKSEYAKASTSKIKNKTSNKSPAKAQVTRIILPMTSLSEEIMQKPKHKLKKPSTIKKVIKPKTPSSSSIESSSTSSDDETKQGRLKAIAKAKTKIKTSKPAETTIKSTIKVSKPETIKPSKTAAVTNIITMANTQITIELLKTNKQNVASWFKM